jgi:hypothetical protein
MPGERFSSSSPTLREIIISEGTSEGFLFAWSRILIT